MKDAKLFSGAIFLFLIFVTVGFFQLLKPQPRAVIQQTKIVELKSYQQDIVPDAKDSELKIVSNSLHVSNSVEVSRNTLYLFEILLQPGVEFTSYDIRPVAPSFKFFKVLIKTLVSPNAP